MNFVVEKTLVNFPWAMDTSKMDYTGGHKFCRNSALRKALKVASISQAWKLEEKVLTEPIKIRTQFKSFFKADSQWSKKWFLCFSLNGINVAFWDDGLFVCFFLFWFLFQLRWNPTYPWYFSGFLSTSVVKYFFLNV